MISFKTNKCRDYNHPEISFNVDETSDFNGSWLIEFFEERVKCGEVFESGETVQVGWMLLTILFDSEETYLELWEPDFDSLPIRWVKGCNNTIRHLSLQKSVCEELSIEADFPSLMQAGLTSPCYNATDGDFYMSRDQAEGRDSGWVFSSIGYDRPESAYKSLYEVSLNQMRTIPFLGLPTESSVKCENGYLIVNYKNKSISSESSVLLENILKASVFV